MRVFLLLPLALSVATPAFAASDSQRDMQRMADTLGNPRTQDAMADGFSAMLGALLNMRVDGIAKALEPMNGGKPIKMKGKTLREVALRDDPKFESKMHNGSKAMVGGLGALAGAMAQAMPELEAAMEKMGDAMDRASPRDDMTD